MTSALISHLRHDLRSAGFTVEGLGGLWGEEAAAALHRGHRVPALRQLREESALGTLATLFVLGLPGTVAALDRALPRLGSVGALELGLVRQTEADVLPLMDLRPYAFVDARGAGEWWIASDLGELALGRAIPESHVLGVGGASSTLSGLIIGVPIEAAMDLGTGCGIQALHASRHAERVVATDISEGALRYARFNAELNEIDSIEFRLGSLFEPVEGETFDQILSNPPFVITPRTAGVPAYEYRDGGMVGDALVGALIASAAAHLRPGGIAQLLGNWEYREETDAFERLDAWIEATGLDAWIVEREVQSVEQYAETWIRDGGTTPGPVFDGLYAAWLDDFAARGVTSIGFGYVTLRAPLEGSTSSLRRLERLGGPVADGLGAHLAACLAAHDWQSGLTDVELARARVAVAGDVTEERHYWPGDDHPTVIDLRQGGGFRRGFPLGTALAAVVGACDGELSIGAISAAVAELLAVDEGQLLAEVLPGVRELLVTGFLAPTE